MAITYFVFVLTLFMSTIVLQIGEPRDRVMALCQMLVTGVMASNVCDEAERITPICSNIYDTSFIVGVTMWVIGTGTKHSSLANIGVYYAYAIIVLSHYNSSESIFF